jgi:hypothetical protein
MRSTSIMFALSAAGLLASAPVGAEVIQGIQFAQGASSFADRVVSYDPRFSGGAQPSSAYRGSFNALGMPDYKGADSCASAAACSFVSLGDGGRITLEFTRSRLTGSGTSAADLYIFEVGGYVEATDVEISANGNDWVSLGRIGGSTRGIDIDSFGFGTTSRFSFVRLTDAFGVDKLGRTAGADIDAVGVLSAAAVPEPASWALMISGLGLVGGTMRRRRQRISADYS